MHTKQNPSEKNPKLKHPHAVSDSNNDSDQTLFLKFIVLESMKDTPITKLSPFIIEKILNSFIKAKSVKKTNQQYPADRSGKKKTFSDLLLKQKYFYNLKIKWSKALGFFLCQLNPEVRRLVRRLECLHLKILKKKQSAVFKQTCLDNELLPKYTKTYLNGS